MFYWISRKQQTNRIIGNSFVGPYTPFVCKKIASGHPLVCENVPFVVFPKYYKWITLTKGVTLIEVMVVVVIVSILGTLAAPSFRTFIANQRLSSEANDLVSDISFARSEAVKRSAAITICKTTNPNASSPDCSVSATDRWTAGRLVFVDTNGDGLLDLSLGEEIIRIRQALDGATTGGNALRGDSNTRDRFTFTASGITNLSADSELFLCDNRGNSQAYSIVVGQLGRARIASKGLDKAGTAIANNVCP
jgi:type IV fimbrial biogenesis protein FimT